MAAKSLQTVSASRVVRLRMEKARNELADLEIGQQQVLEYIVQLDPNIDRLTNYSRWHRAWQGRVGDVEFTDLVEQAVTHFKSITE